MGRILDNPTLLGAIQFSTGTFSALAGTTLDLSAATVTLPANALTRAMLPVLQGDTGQGGLRGAVPAPAAGDAAAAKFLSASGQWLVPSYQVPGSAPVIVSPITTAGDLIVGDANGAPVRFPTPTPDVQTEKVLAWTHANGVQWADAPAAGAATGGGATTLAALTDVDESSAPTPGQALVFFAGTGGASGKWKPGTVAAGSGGGGFFAAASLNMDTGTYPDFMRAKGCSVVHVSGGVYDVTFNTPQVDAQYIILLGAKWNYDVAGDTSLPVVGVSRDANHPKTANGFRVVCATPYDLELWFACGYPEALVSA